MKLETLLKKLQTMNYWDMQKFWDKDWDDSCPCFEGTKIVDGKKVYVRGECWRVSHNPQDLHICGELDKDALLKIAKAVKKALDKQKWYKPYTIVCDEPMENTK